MKARTQPGSVLFLSQRDTLEAGAGDIQLAMDAVERALVARHRGDTILPNKVVLRWGDVSSEGTLGRINVMPAYVGEPYRMAGLKWIGSRPGNLQRGLPRASGLIVLSDPETMFPVAVMDASVISGMRTGAVSGLAARHLAPPGSRRLVVVGAGVQGRTQALAVVAGVPSIETVLFYDVDRERATECARAVERAVGRPCQAIDDLQAAARAADIVVTATTANKPVLDAEMLGLVTREGPGSIQAPGPELGLLQSLGRAHGQGSGTAPRRPGGRWDSGWLLVQIAGYEVDVDILQYAHKVVVDDWDEVVHRGISTVARAAQMGLMAREKLHAQLGAILAGDRPGRERSDEGIFFNAVGVAVGDVALAVEVLQRALQRGIGQELKLFEPVDWFAHVSPLMATG